MNSHSGISYSFILALFLFLTSGTSAQLPQEQSLWPNGIPGNPVKYKEEKVRSENFRTSSLSQQNRVFSCVSEPTYIIHKPEKGKSNGVAIVICPGGGFRDVWFDREGNDFGLWLSQRGVTSLVIKYRTFNSDAEGFKMKRNDYNPHVIADARQAIYTLRSRAEEFGIDKSKIGICGFSAGGSLSLMVAAGSNKNNLPSYANFNNVKTDPDFTGLFYPGLDPGLINLAGNADTFSPVFTAGWPHAVCRLPN